MWCESALDVAKGADVLVVLTEWNEFRALDLKRMRATMLGNVLVDLRNVYPQALAEDAGFVYYGIGRSLPPPAMNKRRETPAAKSRDIRQVTH
jgi:UDPglucose 6-dehydrogenase